jgi:hypothetical protein
MDISIWRAAVWTSANTLDELLENQLNHRPISRLRVRDDSRPGENSSQRKNSAFLDLQARFHPIFARWLMRSSTWMACDWDLHTAR